MTRTLKLENGSSLVVADDDSGERTGVWIEEALGVPMFLSPRDVGRLIAALSRTKAARADRQRGPG